MGDSIEDRAYELVAKDRGVKRTKLTPDTTLSNDLGMDGDDAVEFFQNFEKEFSVDLKALGEDWDCYFGPEGMPLRATLLVIVPGSIISILLIKFLPRLPDWTCFFLGFLLWLTVRFTWVRFFSKKQEPQITIRDLIDCASAGKWTKTVPEDIKKKITARRPNVGLFH